MLVTCFASVFLLKDSEWVAMNDQVSWEFVRLKTVKNIEGHHSLILQISSNKHFPPDQILLETKIMSGSKWILVADDFAEFEVGGQRYGAYFENSVKASAFTASVSEGLSEVHKGNDQSRCIESGYGNECSSDENRANNAPRNPRRRKSLAKFEVVNQALEDSIASAAEALKSSTLDDCSDDEKVIHNDSKDVVEPKTTNQGGLAKENVSELDVSDRVCDSEETHAKDESGVVATDCSDTVVDSATPSHEKKISWSPAKKGAQAISSISSIFRKSTPKNATPAMESNYNMKKNLAPKNVEQFLPPPPPDRKMLGCLPSIRGVEELDDPEEAVRNSHISAPESCLHMTCVTFNEELGRYEGLPDEWKIQNAVFGVALEDLPKRKAPDGNYLEPIPTVLLVMKEHLLRLNALSVIGIFRLAPDKDACSLAKQQINLGEYDYNDCQDPNILANLIKVFFREMPENLLNSVPENEILKIASLKTIDEVVAEMKSAIIDVPKYSLILWLLDLMALFVRHEHVNKMSAKNMAIVVSPNLYAVTTENSMVALTMAQKVAEFTTKILAGWLKMTYNYEVDIN